MSGLVATGGYELESTEFVAGSYPPNTALSANQEGTIQPGFFYRDNVCGVVSDGVLTNRDSKQILRFWSYFLPDNPQNTTTY